MTVSVAVADRSEAAELALCVLSGDFGALTAAKATLEALNTTSRIDDTHGSGVERVAGGGDLHLVQRVGLAVFPLDCLISVDGRAGKERKVRADVLEDDRAVIWMNVRLHGFTPFVAVKRAAPYLPLLLANLFPHRLSGSQQDPLNTEEITM